MPSGGNEDILIGIGSQDPADGPLIGDEQTGQILHCKEGFLFTGLPEKAVHQGLTAFLRVGDRQVLRGEESKPYPYLLTSGEGLAGGFLLADSSVPQLAISQEGRVILRALLGDLFREGSGLYRGEVIVLD
jgi:hypothetical protein